MLGARWRARLLFSVDSLRAPVGYGLNIFGTRALGLAHVRIDTLWSAGC
jgi:hypothetical protein